MKAVAITNKGFEDSLSLEVNELVGKNNLDDSCVIFDVKNNFELANFCYKTQSSTHVMKLLFSSPLTELKSKLENFDLNFDDSFRISCISNELESYEKQELERELGAIIHDKYHVPVNLENPKFNFIIFINSNITYFGIDYVGFDISKRDYRIHRSSKSLKGNVAYSLLRLAGIKKGDNLLDPFTRAGEIAIEFGLWNMNKSPHFYNKEQFKFLKYFDYNFIDDISESSSKIFCVSNLNATVRASEKNAKIAGISNLTFSKLDVDWYDVRLGENSIDYIITKPLEPSSIMPESKLNSLFHEFFYQANIILKPNGKVVFICQKDYYFKDLVKNTNFELLWEKEVMIGKLDIFVLTFIRKK